MNLIQRIAKNITVLIFSEIIGIILSFLYIIYTTRYLGVEQFGLLSFALAFTAIFTVIADLGLNQLIVRDGSRDKSLIKQYVGNVFIIRLIFTLFTFMIITKMMFSFNYSAIKITIVYIITIALFFTCFSDALNSVIRVFEKMEYISIEKILKSALMLVLALFAINQNLEVVEFAYIYLIVNAATFIYVLIICRIKKFITIKLQINLKLWKKLIKNSLLFFLTIIIARMLIFNMDLVLLSELKGDEFAGLYKAAVTIILIIISLVDLFIFAIFPVTSKFFVTSQESLKRLMEFSSKYLFIIALPISTLLFFFADEIILFLYGIEFADAALALKLLSLFLPIRAVSLELGWILASINKEPLRTISAMIALIINISINLIIIPTLGITGVCISAILAQVILFISYFYFVSKHFHRLSLNKIALKPCISWSIMAIFLFIPLWINSFLIILISLLIYVVILLLLKTIDDNDKELIKNLINPIFQLLNKNEGKTENG